MEVDKSRFSLAGKLALVVALDVAAVAGVAGEVQDGSGEIGVAVFGEHYDAAEVAVDQAAVFGIAGE